MKDQLIRLIAAVIRDQFARREVISYEMIAEAIVDKISQDSWVAPRELTDGQADVALNGAGSRTNGAQLAENRDKMKKRFARLRDHLIT